MIACNSIEPWRLSAPGFVLAREFFVFAATRIRALDLAT